MQAMQSNNATGQGINSGKFVALRHVTRQMRLNPSAVPGVRRTSVVATEYVSAETVPSAIPSTVPSAIRGAIPGTIPYMSTEVAEGAGLAHDAGNLLGALSLYSDLLAMPGVLYEEHREYASELRMLSDRSWAMIDRLVNHARSGRSPKLAEGASVLPDVVDGCKGLLRRVAGRTVEISYGVGAFEPVAVPVESVERILTNLVKNAAEATPWVGAISVTVEGATEPVSEDKATVRRRVMLTVRDCGCGMDAAAVRRLMQPGGISSSNGHGLGFRVVRELVAISGGCLRIESQPDLGTSITVEWYAEPSVDKAALRWDTVNPETNAKTAVQQGEGKRQEQQQIPCEDDDENSNRKDKSSAQGRASGVSAGWLEPMSEDMDSSAGSGRAMWHSGTVRRCLEGEAGWIAC